MFEQPFMMSWPSKNRTVATPIALDFGSRHENATGSSATAAVTIGDNPNRLLIISVGSSDTTDSVSTVTLGAQSFSAGPSAHNTNNFVEIWYLIAPNTGAGTITVTFSGSVPVPAIGVLSVYNCDQTNGINTSANATRTQTEANTFITVTPTNAGSWVAGAFNSEGNMTAIDSSIYANGLSDTSNYHQVGGYISNPTISSGNTITVTQASAQSSCAGIEILRA